MIYTKWLGPVCLLLSATVSPAQNFLGISTSPNTGTHRTYLNPALAAETPHRLFLHAGSANLHVNNNFVRYQAPFSLLKLFTGNVPDVYRQANGNVRFESDYTTEILDGKPKNATVWGELRGPAIQMRLGPTAGVLTFSTRLRGIGQVNGASEQLLSALRASLNTSSLYSIPSSDNRFGVNTNAYAELALSYANTIVDADGFRVSGGLTVKRLRGYSAGSFVNRGLDYQLEAGTGPNADPALVVSRVNADLAYTTFLENRRLTPSTLFSANAPGRGWGFDLGLSVLLQSDDDRLLQLGLGLTDLGGMKYTGEVYDVNQRNVRFEADDFNSTNVGSFEQVATVIRNRLGILEDADPSPFRVGLPTSLNFTADYQLSAHTGISAVWLQNVRAADDPSVRQPSLVSIAPRFETGVVGLSLPITYINRGVALGLTIKAGPVRVGSDNLLGLLGSGQNGLRPRGTDIYAGVMLGIKSRDEE
ncbi:hypothetical protein F5984_17435 [Rudanella paleaurantiibacter]|uniref:DUF5723 domain-containing protein n=1 Tax=Rudanella paleaurantiibacter TaxID=2614655 RepID=A0A7J5TVZ5_9BACT|nr:DUF5723 family protein [Rudanella paleaurantiibacter]KAB7728624.1 hypothetical protein F5984_17435 [Rudanella paleaurantiibacter]